MRHTSLLLTALLSFALLPGCIELTRQPASPDAGTPDGVDTAAPEIEEAGPQANVRLVHAASDVGPVDVYAAGGDVPLYSGLGYTQVSDWLTVDAGDYVFELRTEGADPTEPPIFVSALISLPEGPSTVVAAGLADGSEDDALRLVPVQEDWGAPRAARARVRLVHAGVDAPELTVRGLEGADFNVERFDSADAEGVVIPTAGGDRIQLLDGNDLLTVFTAPPFADGDAVLLVATGSLESLAREEEGFKLVAVGSQGALGEIRQDPQVFTVHGARDAGALENCTGTGETAVAANIDYGQIQSDFVSPGEYRFEVHTYPSGCTNVLNEGGTASGPLEAGERYMLLLSGEVTPVENEPFIQVASFKEQFTLDDADVAQVRFVHGASYTQIYIGNVLDGEIAEENVFTDGIAWRAESVEVALPEGSYVLGAADANGEFAPPLSPIVTFDVNASPGARAWGIVTGDPVIDDDDDEFLQLMVVNTSVPDWEVALVDVN